MANDANACIRAVKNAGGETILAHPYWNRHRYDHYAYLEGFAAIEVFNATCDTIGRSSSEVDWSHLLDAGRILPAVAVDDSHGNPHDTGVGWTMLRLKTLNVPSVLQALRTGCFYGTTGPTIHDCRLHNGRLRVRCSPAAAVYLMRHDGAGGGARYAGRLQLTDVEFMVSSDWHCYRIVVVDRTGRRAWTNPFALNEAAFREYAKTLAAEQAENWRRPYPAAKGAPRRAWRMLDLSPVANRALTGEDGWLGQGRELSQLVPGEHVIHGVPFRVEKPAEPDGACVVAVRSARFQTLDGRPVPPAIRLPVNATCKAVYFLHGAGFTEKHSPIGQYEFIYADGRVRTLDVVALGNSSKQGGPQRAARARVQDWWPALPQFENRGARKVIVAPQDQPRDRRYLYTCEWRNPRPTQALKEIRLRGVPRGMAALFVLAVTLRLAPNARRRQTSTSRAAAPRGRSRASS